MAKEPLRSASSRNFDRRTVPENFPSRVTVPQGNNARSPSPSRARTRLCPEVNKHEANRGFARNDSAPVKRQENKPTTTAEELRMKDVVFLRKMLAINKKQEMMLNKRLARLLEGEEFVNFAEGREKSKVVADPPSITSSGAESQEVKYVVDKAPTPIENTSSDRSLDSSPQETTVEKAAINMQDIPVLKITSAKKVQYDINGRRIFYYSEIERDSTEDKEQKHEVTNTPSSKRLETKFVKKGSACSKKTFTMKKSLTYINSQGKLLKKPSTKNKKKARKEDGDSPSNSNCDNPLDFELRPKKVDCQGDAGQVQNVVVHCSTVFRNSPTSKKNIKVWNYESLPSLKSNNSLENKHVSSDQRLQEAGDGKNIRNRPMSIRNAQNKDGRGATLETVFHVRSKFSDGTH